MFPNGEISLFVRITTSKQITNIVIANVSLYFADYHFPLFSLETCFVWNVLDEKTDHFVFKVLYVTHQPC